MKSTFVKRHYALSAALVVTIAVVATMSVAAWGSKSTAKASGAGVYSVALTSTVTTWDPSASFSTEATYMANMYEPLIYTAEPGNKKHYIPCLATSWTKSKNGLVWIFNLRHGVTFHDGTPFNSAAVKYSLLRTKATTGGAGYLLAPIKSITPMGTYQVKITLSYAAGLERILGANYGMWMFSPKTASIKNWDSTPKEDGTGPWVLKSYKAGDSLLFERYAKYWGGWKSNQFNDVAVQIVADATTQQQMLTSGSVDFMDMVNPDQVKSLSKNKNVKVYKILTWDNYLMFFNTQRAPLNNVAVRQALSYAVPYKDIITIGMSGYASQARGPVPVGLWPNDTGKKLPQYTYNLTKADKMLTAAGYPKAKRGKIKLTMTYASENTAEKAFTPLIKASFKKIGISVDPTPLLWNTQYAKGIGSAANRQDLFVVLWWPTPDGYDNLTTLFQTEKKPAWNFAYWYNKAYDKLTSSAYKLNATNPKAAQAEFTTAQKTLITQAPAAYLFDADVLVAARKNIKYVYTGGLGAGNPNYSMVQFWKYVTK